MLPQLVWDYVASGRLDKQIDFSADDKILAAAGKAASSSSYTNSHSNGNGNGNSSGSAKGLQFSAEQLAFLERKRGGSVGPQGGSSAAAAGPTAGQFSAEQLAFLERKRAASAGPSGAGNGAAARSGNGTGNGNGAGAASAVQAAVSRGLISQQEATSLSAEQLEFLARKRGVLV